MSYKPFLIITILLQMSLTARADLVPWQDYGISDSVYLVTTIKIKPNMGDAYLEGLKNTWVTQQEIARELGHIEDYKIYRSDPFEGSGFNLMLVVKFKETQDLAPSREKYKKFMQEWGEKKAEKKNEYARKKYPGIREILEQKYMREIIIK